MNGFSAAISGVGGAIGRYFSIVSFIPSLFLAAFTFALIESGSWSGSGGPDWVRAGNAFTHLGNLVLLTLISIALGVVVHPVQFALVQLFEGYWGTAGWRNGRESRESGTISRGLEASSLARTNVLSWHWKMKKTLLTGVKG